MKVEDRAEMAFTAANDQTLAAVVDVMYKLLKQRPNQIKKIARFIGMDEADFSEFAEKADVEDVVDVLMAVRPLARLGFEQSMAALSRRVAEGGEANDGQ